MQIHELNPFQGTLGSEAFLVVDNGEDTGKISVERLTEPINERIDDIITSPAPTEQEIIDARRGWNEVYYATLGGAIRSQVKQILAQFYKFNTYDLLGVYGTPISRTRNGVTFTWDEAGQVCEVSGEAVGGDAYASIYTQTGAWQGIFERGVTYTIGYETTDPNVKLRIAVWEGVETTPDYYYFDENGHFGIPPEAAKIGVDLWVESGDSVSAVVKNVYMLRTYTAEEVTATIRDAMIGADLHMYNSLGDAIREQLNGKVDKVTGKVLSSNDFTDAEKTKLSGIEAGSEVNAIEAIKLDGTELTPDANRAVNIPVDETLTTEGVPADAKTVGEELENKLAIDGYSELATVGNTEQVVATQHITDTEPYIYRKTGSPNDVGDRVYDTIVGGSVVWNQLAALDATKWNNKIRASITFNGTKLKYQPTSSSSNLKAIGFSISPNHKYFVSGKQIANESTVGMTYGLYTALSSNDYVVREVHALDTDYSFAKVWSSGETGVYFGFTTSTSATTDDYVTVDKLQVIDLTAALTPTIADYIYTLEQANAGAGVAYFRKYFQKEYYEYCEPHFEHVQTSAKETVGFNQWDEEWENGGINVAGEKETASNCIRSKNYIPALPNIAYCNSSSTVLYIHFYDSEKQQISWNQFTAGQVRTSPEGTAFILFQAVPVYGTTYKNDICLNIHGDRDGEYEAYQKRTYPIEAKVLRGIPKLDSANRLYFDGDVMRHDGTGARRYGIVNSADCTVGVYDANTGRCSLVMPSSAPPHKRAPVADILNMNPSNYFKVTSKNGVAQANYSISASDPANDRSYIFTLDSTQVTTGTQAVEWVRNHPFDLVYELETPEPFTAEPYQSPMVVDPLGTEEFVDYAVEQGDRDVAVPVGHTSEYPPDLRGKLQHLPSLASADGRYVVVQAGNQMSLAPDTSLGLIAALEARVAALEGGNG